MIKKLFIFLFSLFAFADLYSQNHYDPYYDPIDSIIKASSLAENDWAIVLTITLGYYVPIMDSLGNVLSKDPDGTYIITKKNNSCTIKILDRTLDSNYSFSYNISKPFSIFDTIICNYTIDSVKKAEKEWIYPNIFKYDSLEVYDVQHKADHSPSFRICFRTKQKENCSHFDDIDIFIPDRIKSWFRKNLNYDYNTSTFTYRSFINIINLLKKQFNIVVLE